MGASRSARYRWHPTTGKDLDPATAEVFGEAIERLTGGVGKDCSPAEVLRLAYPPTSPIHGMFEWNDNLAAENYRLHQASVYIRALVTVVPGRAEKPIAAKVTYRSPKRPDVPEEASSTDLRRRLLMLGVAELRTWANRFGRLEEFADVVCAIEAVEEQLKRSLRPTAVVARQARRG